MFERAGSGAAARDRGRERTGDVEWTDGPAAALTARERAVRRTGDVTADHGARSPLAARRADIEALYGKRRPMKLVYGSAKSLGGHGSVWHIGVSGGTHTHNHRRLGIRVMEHRYTTEQLEQDKRRDGYATMTRDERRAYDWGTRARIMGISESTPPPPPPPPSGGAAQVHYSQIIAAAADAQHRYAVKIERRGRIGRYSYSINEAYRRASLLEEIADQAAAIAPPPPPPPPSGGAAQVLHAFGAVYISYAPRSAALTCIAIADCEWEIDTDYSHAVDAATTHMVTVHAAANTRYVKTDEHKASLVGEHWITPGVITDEARAPSWLKPISGGADLSALKAEWDCDSILFTLDGVSVEDYGDLITLTDDTDWYAQCVTRVINQSLDAVDLARRHCALMSDAAIWTVDVTLNRLLEYVSATVQAAVALDSDELFALTMAVDSNVALINAMCGISREWTAQFADDLDSYLLDEAAAREWYGFEPIDPDDAYDVKLMTLKPISGGADIASTIRAAAREVRGVEVMTHDPVETLVLAAASGDGAARAQLRKSAIEDRRSRRAAYHGKRNHRRRGYTRDDRRAIREALREIDDLTDDEALYALDLQDVSGGTFCSLDFCPACMRSLDQCVNPERVDLYLAGYVISGDLVCLDCTPDCLTVDGAIGGDGESIGIVDQFGDPGHECLECGDWIVHQCADCELPLFELDAVSVCEC